MAVMRDVAAERKETILFAAAKMAHVEGPPDRERMALLRQMAEWLAVPKSDYRRFTASFAAQWEASRYVPKPGQ
ncbi:hypothetical protein JM946_08215 [Steroidobacter sp. S1-65]|uniref:Uncharacterized protein n=1 Tax=Steroidobacter gossypii TaxID=2805490 RepID=A0ABS1WUS9_9GAMM|nr:hypothetical protein [Steroidobacter gossypii]MBM0104728.1 hypothetical protein [Steroidobacter gossypii]